MGIWKSDFSAANVRRRHVNDICDLVGSRVMSNAMRDQTLEHRAPLPDPNSVAGFIGHVRVFGSTIVDHHQRHECEDEPDDAFYPEFRGSDQSHNGCIGRRSP